ncbi:calsequestrin-2 [Galendromus occidentalis]|uniref:Calsequestrin n=1 Tax=Galendromus occidentalis TaxID=34638 RepID=A0AAJ6VWL2_9ACAR|nr:calsequestrin-2 [Galendromus occidentalis]
MRTICFALLFSLGALTSADVLSFLEPRESEVIAVVETLVNEEELKGKPLAVVFVTNRFTDPHADAVSQLLSGRSQPVSVFIAPEGILKDVKGGTILVYRDGRRTFYHGIRDAATILNFVKLIDQARMVAITNKIDKMAFERTRGTKVVGYFAAGASELTVFEEAAKLFGAKVSFFLVTDAIVAKHLKLNATGQISLVRPFDKTPVQCPQNPATLADIQRLIVLNKETFVKVTPMNARDPSFNKSLSLVLITDSSPLSYHLLKLVSRNHRNGTTKDLQTLWIELTEFPLMDPSISPLQGLSALPGLGFWDPISDSYEWLDLATLNTAPNDQIQEDANLLAIQTFIASRYRPNVPSIDPAPETAKIEL